jgi:RNA polymerase sigma-70 factor (ECF subfamily)
MCRREEGAFRKVYLNSIGPLTGFLQVLLHSREEAEDIAQNVFANIWENLDNIDPSRNFSGYLYVIAKNMAFKQMARKKLYEKYRDYAVNLEAPLDLATDEVVINRETALLINIYVENMPTQRKRVFEMHNKHGKSDSDRASLLDVSINTVRTHLKLAKKGLRELMTIASMIFFALVCEPF